MKVIAIKDFYNSPRFGLTITPDMKNFQHKDAVPKGHRFEIGKAIDYRTSLEDDKVRIGQLCAARCIIFDTADNAGVIDQLEKQVDADIAERKAFAERQKLASTLTVPALLAAFPKMIADAIAAAQMKPARA